MVRSGGSGALGCDHVFGNTVWKIEGNWTLENKRDSKQKRFLGQAVGTMFKNTIKKANLRSGIYSFECYYKLSGKRPQTVL